MGAAAFIDPRTGEVLALTSRPGFDPNLFVRRFNRSLWRALVSDPSHPLQDRAIQAAYSPGSTFKLIMTAAALEEGLITESTTFNCTGKAEFYGRIFSCHEKGGHGVTDLHRAIIKSCNIYFYNVGRKLGIEKIAEYARRFGLGRPTGIGMAFEEPGLVPDEAWKQRVVGDRWYPSETISVAIGQGPLLVTVLQQAVMAAALATDGRTMTPTLHLVDSSAGSQSAEAPPREKRGEPLKPETLDVIRRAMWGVVHEAGTGSKANIPGFDVCGKTGTAQVVVASVGVKNEELLPLEQRDHSWFIGFAPASRPEVAFAILVEHVGHGSEAAAPIAKAVLEAYLEKRPKPLAPPSEVASGPSGAASRIF
jgi:penicillin-binding protein 2